MSSKREAILAAIVATLSAPSATPAGGNVFRSRLEALASSMLPAIIVRPGASDAPSEATIGPVNRQLEVEVIVYMEGPVPDSLADPTVVAAHEKIMADRTVGGRALDLNEAATQFAFDRGDKDSVEITMNYTVRYRTGAANLSA